MAGILRVEWPRAFGGRGPQISKVVVVDGGCGARGGGTWGPCPGAGALNYMTIITSLRFEDTWPIYRRSRPGLPLEKNFFFNYILK